MSHPEFVVLNPVLGRIQSLKALVLSFSFLSQRNGKSGGISLKLLHCLEFNPTESCKPGEDYPLPLRRKEEEKMAEVHLHINAINIQFIAPETLF